MKRIPTAARGGERAADGRRADRPLDGAGRQIPRAELPRVRGVPLELGLAQPDHDEPVEDADRRRDRSRRPDRGLAREPDLDPGRGGETVGDERRLERHDGPPLAERCLDLVGDPDQVLHASSLVVAAWDARRSARGLGPAYPRPRPPAGAPMSLVSRYRGRRHAWVPAS